MQQTLANKLLARQKDILKQLSVKSITPLEKAALLKKFNAVSTEMESALTKCRELNTPSPAAKKPKTITKAELESKQQQLQRDALDRELDLIQSAKKPPKPEEKTTDVLRERLLQAEKEAESLGLDYGNVAGRGRGRGRGSNVASRQPKRYSMDMRSTTLRATHVPAELLNEETLKTHFCSFGPITSVVVDPVDAVIKFANRWTAEAAMSYGGSIGNQPITLSWADEPNPVVATPQKKRRVRLSLFLNLIRARMTLLRWWSNKGMTKRPTKTKTKILNLTMKKMRIETHLGSDSVEYLFSFV